MTRVGLCWTAAAVLATLMACGGGSGSGGSGGGGGGSNPPPPPASTNPCQSAAALADEPVDAIPPASPVRKRGVIDGSTRWNVLDALWRHRAAQARRAQMPQIPFDAPRAAPRDSVDVGEIAVIQDEGDLVDPANLFDLANVGLRFTWSGSGYDVTRIDGTFRQTLGTRQTLTDDDSVNVNVRFGFSFYGRTQQTAFVNSDGNITFEEEDKASTERNIARLLTGPPRVSPFLSDLDPTTGSGRIFVNAADGEYTVTWCNVREFDSNLIVTAQATLLPSGVIEFKFESPTIGSAIVGLSPGRTGIFNPVDLSAASSSGGSGALGERFATSPELDIAALAKKFYRDHPDDYDQLVIWTDARYVPQGAFAYETTVANEVRGIGIPVFDLARDFGSGGRLRSLAVMDFAGKYPDNPTTKFLGENNTLSVLGQEAGHRWLAFVEFRNHERVRSDALLGRGQSHWSFFFDSDASVMEGNDIEDRGGSFRTVGAVQRYSALDQYLMGLIPPSDVPPFFYVENPVPSRDRGDPPQVGVSFTGTKREVLIDDVVMIHGARDPSAARTSKVHRQAFIYMVTAGRGTDSAQIAKVDRIRQEWMTFFGQATNNKMAAETRLR